MADLIPMNRNFVTELEQSNKLVFCSMKAETLEEKKILFNAMNTPDKRLADCVNQQITIKDVFCETVEVNTADGFDKGVAPRIILIDIDGVSYNCVSQGVFNALQKLFTLFGPPTWSDGLKVKVIQINKNQRRMLNLELA